jgi:acetoin utilization protein AcuC
VTVLAKQRVGLAYHDKYQLYDFGSGHPFRGDRFNNAMELFEEQGLLDLPNVKIIKPEIAKIENLLVVHNKSYVDLIFDFAKKNRPYDFDTPVSPNILEGALYIVGGAIKIAEEISSGGIERGISLGGGLHHAGEDFGGGFCLFNDVAILARFLQSECGFRRVLIFDYDVHAGNGTSDIFYSDPSVLYISVHQDPKTLFPGTGFISQIGKGEGVGFNVNLSLPPGTRGKTYFNAVKEIFPPLAKEFKPDIILANGGSDPHFADILGSLSLTIRDFFDLSRLIVDTAENISNGKLVLLVGSGYNPSVLPSCWYALSAAVADVKDLQLTDPSEPPVEPPWCSTRIKTTLKDLRRILKKHWKCFR